MQAGKHVLCEKPLAMSADQAQEMVDASTQTRGCCFRRRSCTATTPPGSRRSAAVRDGRIGDLQAVHTFFSYFNDDAVQHPQPP